MGKNRSLESDNKNDFEDIQEKLHFYLSSIKDIKKKGFSTLQILLYSIVIFFFIFNLVLLMIGTNLIILIIAVGISIVVVYFDKKMFFRDSSDL